MKLLTIFIILLSIIVLVYATVDATTDYDYNNGDANVNGATFHCIGNCNETKPREKDIRGGTALCGGHMYPGVTKNEDLKVYEWLLERAKGGDVLVLTADSAPCDIYNKFIYDLKPKPNSVTTICFTSRDGSYIKKTEDLIKGASVVFITGGDQAKYYNFWKDTVISKYLPYVPLVGGSSAGLAVQGEFVFTALHDSIESEEALHNPMNEAITLTNHFFNLPFMLNIITDTHFYQRDRMGRLITFLARIVKNKWIHHPYYHNAMGIGISEHTAVLVDHISGNCTITGDGPVYFIRSNPYVKRCNDDDSLTYEDLLVHKWNGTLVSSSNNDDDGTVSLKDWKFSKNGWKQYNLSAVYGELKSTQKNGRIY
jgi:cyanophycinase|tara:strand:+ start:30 stop:1136 length:1107 start_codon:yes stop_codon:yes gene_type:complete